MRGNSQYVMSWCHSCSQHHIPTLRVCDATSHWWRSKSKPTSKVNYLGRWISLRIRHGLDFATHFWPSLRKNCIKNRIELLKRYTFFHNTLLTEIVPQWLNYSIDELKFVIRCDNVVWTRFNRHTNKTTKKIHILA